VLFLQRFRKARRWGVLVLVPAAAMMLIATSLAGAETGILPDSANPDETTAGVSAPMRSRVVLHVRRNVLRGHTALARGRVWPHAGNRRVTIRLNGDKVRTVRASDSGRYRVRWRAPGSGVYQAIAIVHRSDTAGKDRSRATRINVFRPALASYYGPGLYGGSTACGGTLTPGTLGVANKTLPCGAKVTLRHRGRTVTVRVIDRGPYAGNREYDLTEATKNKLGFGSTGTVLTTR
jgi:peptidoglycan lytic transglycosylase